MSAQALGATIGLSRYSEKVERFFFAPARTEPLAALRIGIGIILWLQALSLAPLLFDFYGANGILQEGVYQATRLTPFSFQDWLNITGRLGLSERVGILSLSGIYLFFLGLFLLGWQTRFAAMGVWFTHLVLTQESTAYGLDQFAHQALFLLMFAPSGESYSIDAFRRGGPNPALPSARLVLRVAQIWLSIAYMASGFSKSLGPQWWDGEAAWRSMMLPTFRQFDMGWVAGYPWIAVAASLGTILIEGLYPFFIWPKATRKIWMTLAIALHLGIGIFMGLWLFAAIMIVLNVALFGFSAEPSTGTAPKPT